MLNINSIGEKLSIMFLKKKQLGVLFKKITYLVFYSIVSSHRF